MRPRKGNSRKVCLLPSSLKTIIPGGKNVTQEARKNLERPAGPSSLVGSRSYMLSVFISTQSLSLDFWKLSCHVQFLGGKKMPLFFSSSYFLAFPALTTRWSDGWGKVSHFTNFPLFFSPELGRWNIYNTMRAVPAPAVFLQNILKFIFIFMCRSVLPSCM